MTDREAMKMALQALEFNLPVIEDFGSKEQLTDCHKAITALYKSLAQPEQEPVCDKDPYYCGYVRCQLGKVCKNTAPPKRQWVGLTNEELVELRETHEAHIFQLMFAIEAKLKEKNGGS